MDTVTDISVEPIEWFQIDATDLAKMLRDDHSSPQWATYKIVPISEDGYRQSVTAEMLYDHDSNRAGIAWGADAQWTDARHRRHDKN